MRVRLASGRSQVRSSGPAASSFVEIGHEIIYTAILSLPLIQIEQLSVIHLVLVNRLGRLPKNNVVRLTDRLDMTIVVDWDVKPQLKQTKYFKIRLTNNDFMPTTNFEYGFCIGKGDNL